jgi:23S rRNA pseudouridine1911/1915/1917 synthase
MVFRIEGLTSPTRLDRVLRQRFPQAGRRQIQSLINSGQVKVNKRLVWLCSWQVHNGDLITLATMPTRKPAGPTIFDDHWILAVEPDLIVVNKPAGLLSEPTRWGQGVSLQDLATQRFGPLKLFHRLDRDTSGVVLLTRSRTLNRYLARAFQAGRVGKTYLAVVHTPNQLKSQGIITERIGRHPRRRDMMRVVGQGGKPAVTRYEVVHEELGKQWVQLEPQTGRTHQLRVHLASRKAPILGDRLYNPRWREAKRLMLHAFRLILPEAASFPQQVYTAPLPKDFLEPADESHWLAWGLRSKSLGSTRGTPS